MTARPNLLKTLMMGATENYRRVVALLGEGAALSFETRPSDDSPQWR